MNLCKWIPTLPSFLPPSSAKNRALLEVVPALMQFMFPVLIEKTTLGGSEGELAYRVTMSHIVIEIFREEKLYSKSFWRANSTRPTTLAARHEDTVETWSLPHPVVEHRRVIRSLVEEAWCSHVPQICCENEVKGMPVKCLARCPLMARAASVFSRVTRVTAAARTKGRLRHSHHAWKGFKLRSKHSCVLHKRFSESARWKCSVFLSLLLRASSGQKCSRWGWLHTCQGSGGGLAPWWSSFLPWEKCYSFSLERCPIRGGINQSCYFILEAIVMYFSSPEDLCCLRLNCS